MSRGLIIAVLMLTALPAPGCMIHPALPPHARPKEWTKPIKRPGLNNFFQVSPMLYRGAQPTALGFRSLSDLGVHTVINLRSFHSDRDELEDLSLHYIHIPMNAWDADEDLALSFLKAVTDRENVPVFVHCKHGSDRTGLMCALYRICVQGWSREQAIDEMRRGGQGYHVIWGGLIDFIRETDLDSLRKRAGLPKPEAAH